MHYTTLYCTKCKNQLKFDSLGLVCPACGIHFPVIDGVISLYDPHLEPESFASIEAQAHDAEADVAKESMGLDLYYNIRTHSYIYQQMANWVPKDSKVLEIGSGVGQDIVALALRGYNNLHASDVSLKSILRARELSIINGISDRLSFYHLDGLHLPFGNDEFDAIFMVAALHHFPVTSEILNEMKRCCRPGGFIMCFIEPNRSYYYIRPLIKIIEKAFSLFKPQDRKRSIAEETAEGFTILQFSELADQVGLNLVSVKSHWVLTGFVYLLQQFFYRILGIVPSALLNSISRLTCLFDDYVTEKPRSLCWHYSVVFQNIK